MRKLNWTPLLLLTSLSCSHTQRHIASVVTQPEFGDLLKASEEILETVESPSLNSQMCKTYLSGVEKNLDNLDLKLSLLGKSKIRPKELLIIRGAFVQSFIHA